MSDTRLLSLFDNLVEWFIPPVIRADKDRRSQARMFLISHLLGPFIGNSVPLALYIFDPQPSWNIVVLAVSITSFWVYPFVLRFTGRYDVLALLSIQNLIFCILWSCYFYGGVMSPTLPWVLTIPLLAFFYTGESARLRLIVLTMFALNLAVFCGMYRFVHAPQSHITIKAMQGLGLTSTIAAALYVTMMALYYARALASQMELEQLMRGHMATAAELRRAAAEAERASIAKAEFLAKMSHELRTPLNAVIGYSQILLETAEDEQDAADVEDLHKIHDAGQHLLQLVNDVLDLSKIEAGRMEVFNEEIAIRSTIHTVVDGLRAFASTNRNTVRITIADDVDTIVGDELKIQGALRQVVDNAIKYTKDGRIDIVCRRSIGRSGPGIAIAVQDTGIGIAAEYLPTLFQQFAGGDDQTSTKYGGTGLGLALARNICRLMGGDITVRTEQGRGSCFTLVLPASPPSKSREGNGDESVPALAPAPFRSSAQPVFGVHAHA